MKYLKLGAIIITSLLFGCSENNKTKTSLSGIDTIKPLTEDKASNLNKASNLSNDKEEIQNLIRNILEWSESKAAIQLIPVLTDSNSVCTGFDLAALKANLENLQGTGFFSADFIDNYNQIILALDKKMKNKEFAEWPKGELPAFNFANDVDPWCGCQDVPYDMPDARSLVEVHVVDLNKENGELYWKWGKLGTDVSKDWKDFSYKFKVKKEDGKWRVSYLQGFDFTESVKI